MTILFIHPARNNQLSALLVVSFLTFLFLLPVNHGLAQSRVISTLLKEDIAQTIFSGDTLGIQNDTAQFTYTRQKKSGNLAMLLSAVIPGAGQIYAHRYYTIPLIWGFGAYFGATAIAANKQYQDFRNKYSESIRLDTLHHTGNDQFKTGRDFYHNQRDEFLFYLAITYILNIVDAYVGATLYDFDVSNDLNGTTTMRFRVPLH
jgi:hypothetical protein